MRRRPQAEWIPLPAHFVHRFHKKMKHESAPGGAINMYEIQDGVTGKTWMTVGMDIEGDEKGQKIRALMRLLNGGK